ncbi:MAG: transcriptional repressor [Hyphomicrobium sp.]|nr:transcriptional repressor [Hyphomicrobium sp.]
MSDSQSKTLFPAPGPQNVARLAKALERAEVIFVEKNLRFTKLRQQVFEEITIAHGSIGAYDILGRIADKGTRLAPISVYRALDALLEAGVIHRLESKNAFFACRRLHTDDFVKGRRPLFLSCEKCGAVAEVDSEGVFDIVARVASAVDFKPRVKFVEVTGTCPRCAEKEAAASALADKPGAGTSKSKPNDH